MCMVIATSSWKGGTGKTTLNVLAMETLARNGKKVLGIDLDSNCALSQCYGQLLKDYTSMEFLSAVVENFQGIYKCSQPDTELLGGLYFAKRAGEIRGGKREF